VGFVFGRAGGPPAALPLGGGRTAPLLAATGFPGDARFPDRKQNSFLGCRKVIFLLLTQEDNLGKKTVIVICIS